jgi:Domain of unknown function (DUF5659)
MKEFTFFCLECYMFNEQTTEDEGMDRVFETRDFYLACFLRCSGYVLQGLRAEGPRKVFVFRDRATRREDVMAFYGDATSVRPLAFAATIKDMKGLLHNG